MLLIGLAALAVLWTAVAALVAGLCASAAAGDRAMLRREGGRAASYTLPRLRTWRTVRSSSFRSAQSDQLAT
jgi:hypothetical protein